MSQSQGTQGQDNAAFDKAANEHAKNTVPYCVECGTSVFPSVQMITIPHPKDEKKDKSYQICNYCGDPLKQRHEDFAGSALTGEILGNLESTRSYAIRIFESPWGKIKVYLSVHSYFAPFVEFLDAFVGVTQIKDEDAKANYLAPFKTQARAIKRLIDEEFSDEAVIQSFHELPAVSDAAIAGFLNQLQDMITHIHLNPNAPVEIDYTVKEVAA